MTPEQEARVVAIALDLAREGRTAELAEFLEHGLSTEVSDASRDTPLMLAAYHGRAETVAALIARGADVNARNARGQSPLAGALFKGEDEVVRLLVAAGADLDGGSPSPRATAAMFGREHLLSAAEPEVRAGDCFICRQNADVNALPLRERILLTEHWRVAHAFDTSLPGWLVLAPRTHVLALDELSTPAADQLGGILRRLTAALRACVGATKTYIALYAEADGFAHVHLHVIPRMPDQPGDAKGPRVFRYLGVAPAEQVGEAARDRLAAALAGALATPGSGA